MTLGALYLGWFARPLTRFEEGVVNELFVESPFALLQSFSRPLRHHGITCTLFGVRPDNGSVCARGAVSVTRATMALDMFDNMSGGMGSRYVGSTPLFYSSDRPADVP